MLLIAVLAWAGTARAADPVHGALLAGLGGCASCHTAEDGAPYAGGYAVRTSFGTFYGPNITPDPKDGIGTWTLADFVRAMRQGRSPQGSSYYPVFPYPAFTGMTNADLADLWAFLRTQKPVAKPDRPHDLRGIYKRRGLVMAFWRMFGFDEGPFQPDPHRSPAWNRGAYLAQAVGHCGDCHTPRNGIGVPMKDEAFVGSPGPPEKTPNITPSADGIGSWSRDDVLSLFQLGILPDGDFVDGGMQHVVYDGTAHLPLSDQEALATWLASIPPRPDP